MIVLEKETEAAEIHSQIKTCCCSGKTETIFFAAKVRTTEDAGLYFEKIRTEKRYYIFHDSTEEIGCEKGISKGVRTAYQSSSGMGCMERFCGNACLLSV